jgi:polar amino acid transport system substrate-binding protein
MNIKRSLFFAFFLLFSGAARPGQGTEISFALLEWPPHTTKTMLAYGIASELVTAITKEMGYTPSYHFYPLKRLLHHVQEGKHWGAFPGSYTKERAEKFYYSDPIFPQVDRFFYYKKQPSVVYQNLVDLLPLTIGGTKGFWYEEGFNKAGLKTYYVAKDLLALKMLMGGRLDLVAINENVGWQLIKKHFPGEIHNFGTLTKPLRVKENFLLASKKYPQTKERLQQFNRALKNVKKNGVYQKIANKYFLLPH